MRKRPVFEFYGEIYKIETKRDGGGRLTIDFGSDSLIPIQMLQRMQVNGDLSFAFAFVPWFPDEDRPRVSFSEKDEGDSSLPDSSPEEGAAP